jgi:hypothetical protein
MISSVTAFRTKLTLWIANIKEKTALQFPHPKNISEPSNEESFEAEPPVGHLENLQGFWRNFYKFSSMNE